MWRMSDQYRLLSVWEQRHKVKTNRKYGKTSFNLLPGGGVDSLISSTFERGLIERGGLIVVGKRH